MQSTKQAYIDATGRSSARSVKSQIYAEGKLTANGAERTASATALPERIGAEAGNAMSVPQIALVSTAESAPLNNMGKNLSESQSDAWESVCDEHFGEVELVLSGKGETKTVLVQVRRPSATQSCVIDWLNCTVLEDTWFKTAGRQLITDEDIIEEASRQLEKIFGFGITAHRGMRLNFYADSWVLGDGMGFVCFGKQNQTMLVMLNGQGCLNAVPGWEKRLYDFLTKTAVRPSISRIDLAHDDLDGSYLSVDWAYQQWWDSGFSFNKGGRPPEIQKLGNWDRPSGKGRTLTIGQRQSSKFCRFYEKGKKEGDKLSLWCRCEMEFKNTNTVIPPEVLLNPSRFFSGAYPCFLSFSHVDTPERMVVKARAQHITVDDSIAITKRQFGKYVRVFRALFGDKAALDMITNTDENAFPKRLKPYLSFADSGPVPVHRQEKPVVYDFIPYPVSTPFFGLNGERARL